MRVRQENRSETTQDQHANRSQQTTNAPASAQGERLTQLRAMIDSSPHTKVQREHADMIANSPLMVAQRNSFTTLHDVAQQAEKPWGRPNNTGLPDNLKSGIESLSGISIGSLKGHYNSNPAQLNAHAYGQATDIHVAPGQEKHLPHEVWHVVQQAQERVKPTMQIKEGVPVNDDKMLEHEADVMGAKAAQFKKRGTLPHQTVIQKVDAEHAPKLEEAFRIASEGGEFDVDRYHASLVEQEYPAENDSCERAPDEPEPAAEIEEVVMADAAPGPAAVGVEEAVEVEEVVMAAAAPDPGVKQLHAAVAQLARSPYAISGPKDYGGLNDILYQCDAQGNIDFSSPSQYYIGNPYPGLNPVTAGSLVDVGPAVAAYGKGNRYQHFKSANQQLPAFGGANGSSPPGLTWHHLSTRHQMHLVNRLVHSKHGHNGGVHIW